MFKHILPVLLIAGFAVGTATQAELDNAEQFIGRMLDGIAATPALCPDEVDVLTRDRDMGSVCAIFKGDFQTFASVWEIQLELDELKRSRGERLPEPVARTPWEVDEEMYQRIYALEDSTIGVRFIDGAILVVYK